MDDPQVNNPNFDEIVRLVDDLPNCLVGMMQVTATLGSSWQWCYMKQHTAH